MKLGGIYISVGAKTNQLARDFTKAKGMAKKTAVLMNHELGKVSFDIKKMAMFGTVATALATGGVLLLGKTFLDTAKSFERYETQLKTITGSSVKAKKAMAWITEFTAKTPYELDQVTESFVKLKAYGLDANKWMGTLGNTAAAMGKGLNQTVEMFADAVVGEFERLKEFGVKTSTQGDKVTFKWSQNGKDMVRVAEKTQSGISMALSGIFSRFDGSMDDLSSTWEGMMSNLSDIWTMYQKDVMDSGPFEAMKISLKSFLDYLSTNEGQMDLKSWANETAIVVMDSFVMMSKGLSVFLSGLKNTQAIYAGFISRLKQFRLLGIESGIKDMQKSIGAGFDSMQNVEIRNGLIVQGELLKKEIEYWDNVGVGAVTAANDIDNSISKITSKIEEWSKTQGKVLAFGGGSDIDSGGGDIKNRGESTKLYNKTSKAMQQARLNGFYEEEKLRAERWQAEIEASNREIELEKENEAALSQARLNAYYEEEDLRSKKWQAEIEYSNKIIALEKETAKRQKEIAKVEQNAKIDIYKNAAGSVADTFKTIAQAGGKQSKEAFKMYKAFALVEAAMNVYQGITKAFAQGGMLGFVTGAAVAAAGAVQIGMIANSQPPSYDAGGISNAGGLYQTGDIQEAHIPIPSGKIPVELGNGGKQKPIQIIMNNPTFQDLETQRQVMAQIATIIATRVAPGAVIENYNNDGGIRQMVRGGA